MTKQAIIEWADELAAYLEKHPVMTRTLEERVWGLVSTRFSMAELDQLIAEVEKRLKRKDNLSSNLSS